MAIDKKMMWAFGGLIALVVIGLVLMVVSGLRRAPKGASDESVALTIPDGEAQPVADSKSAAMRGAVSLDQYFGELPPEGASGDVSLVSGAPSAASSEPRAAESDEAVVARTFGVPASTSGSHSGGASRGGRPASRPMSQEERLEYERKRAEMVKEVLTGASTDEMPDQVGHDGGRAGHDDAPASIDLSAVGSSDGIITTLDDEPSERVGYGIRPFRCMIVRDQKIKSGQRVTVRLLEDYVDGAVRIPANTHLSAICKIGERLELSVRSLELGGRIVPLLLEAYDSDGLPGIYCPETSAAKNARKASDEAISTAGRTFGGLVGDLASTVLRTGATIAKSASGEVSVAVVNGYEFYLVKSERR